MDLLTKGIVSLRRFGFRVLFAVLRLLRPRLQRGTGRTVLLLQYASPLGCCVHGTPLVAALKQAGNTRVVVATRSTGAATLRHDPNVDVLLETADPMASRGSLWTVARSLRRQLKESGEYPALILQDASSRSGTHALFAALLRLAPTAGFSQMESMYDETLIYDQDRSLIDNNLRLTRVGAKIPPHREPAVYFTASELHRVRDMLAAANPWRRTLVAFVLQGSGGQRTMWHDDRFAAVIRHLESKGCTAIFLGTESDAASIERVRTEAGSSGVSLAGKTSIAELAAVLCECDLVVTLDTGTMHVARASQTPMVVLGPSWQKPLEWLPLGVDRARIVRGDDRKDVPTNYRLDEISVSSVITAAEELLALYPPSPDARVARTSAKLSEIRP